MRKRQKGFYALLVLLMLFVGSGTFFFHMMRGSEIQVENKRQAKTLESLEKAAQALIGYASLEVGERPRPGELPCPDADYDGSSDYQGANCKVLSGWFPWRTLKEEELVDGEGARLWYVVSQDFYNRSGLAIEPVLNSGNIGQISVDGLAAAAIVISPGMTLPDQRRQINPPVDIADYLEGENADDDTSYTLSPAQGGNDIIRAITVDEIMVNVEKLVVGKAASELNNYYLNNGFYPYAEDLHDGVCDANSPLNALGLGFLPLSDPLGTCPYNVLNGLPIWFQANNWNEYILLAVSLSCTFGTNACNGGGQKLTYEQSANIDALVVSSGKQLVAANLCGNTYNQARAAGLFNVCDYLDNIENTNLDARYARSPLSRNYNDQIFIVRP